MLLGKAFALTTALLAMWLSPAVGQNYDSVSKAALHVFQVMTFSYPGFNGSVTFWPTSRVPKAKGKVSIVRECETTIIVARLDDIPPAKSFGAAFNTYVLWLISPEGKLETAGEFVLHGDKGELFTGTALGSFGMFVSVEPNRHVKAPSQFVVFVNATSVDGILEPGRPAIINYAPLP